jgi:DNA-binding transcriptional MocR family regulator
MNAPSKTLINLLRGWPHPDLLPAARLKPATTSALSDSTISTQGLEYGPDDGYPPLRDQLTQLLTNFYKPKQAIEANRICITGGASQSLACLLQVFTDPLYTRNVWMIAPTYFLACRIFEDSGFEGRLRAVPEDEEGIDIDFLAAQIKKSEEKAKAEGNTVPVYPTWRTYLGCSCRLGIER